MTRDYSIPASESLAPIDIHTRSLSGTASFWNVFLRTPRSGFHTDIRRRTWAERKERKPDYSTSHQSMKRSIIRATDFAVL